MGKKENKIYCYDNENIKRNNILTQLDDELVVFYESCDIDSESRY